MGGGAFDVSIQWSIQNDAHLSYNNTPRVRIQMLDGKLIVSPEVQ